MPASVHPIANAKARQKDPLDLYYDKAIITELRDQLEELRRDVVSCRELGRRLFATTDAAFGAAVVATACAEEDKPKKRWFKPKKRWFI